MNLLITQKQAIVTMIALLAVVLAMHILVLAEIIPYSFIWAGKISNLKEMRALEVPSICMNSLLILIFLFKGDFIRNNISNKILNAIIWILVVLFCLNTVANLFAKSPFELYFFTPLSFASALLCLRIVLSK